jgi:hypothetical protein
MSMARPASDSTIEWGSGQESRSKRRKRAAQANERSTIQRRVNNTKPRLASRCLTTSNATRVALPPPRAARPCSLVHKPHLPVRSRWHLARPQANRPPASPRQLELRAHAAQPRRGKNEGKLIDAFDSLVMVFSICLPQRRSRHLVKGQQSSQHHFLSVARQFLYSSRTSSREQRSR